MVTRIRIDAEGSTRDEVESHLDAVFHLIFLSHSSQFTFTVGGSPSYASPSSSIPRESEFAEEVYESQVDGRGVITWKGRRILRFRERARIESS